MNANRSSLAPVAEIASGTGSVIEGSFSENRSASGPKTPAGKRRSSRNSLKAGLYASAVVVRGESEAEYLAFARTIVAGFDVQTALEMAIAERLVSALWRARRARRYETAYLNTAAERIGELRRFLGAADRELAECRAEIEHVERLWYPRTLPASAIEAASRGVLRVAKRCLPAAWRDVEDAIPYPTRKRVSKKWVAAFREAIRDAMLPIFEGTPNASAVVSWIVRKLRDCERNLEAEHEIKRRAYERASPSEFILPTDEGLAIGNVVLSSTAPGKVLADAEGRLDRQVSRALADLEAARRLRPA